ncbi:MAG: hypothetical protein ACI91R_000763 [Vicingaceae bacterium]|jgi:hypothetical protein
MQRAKANKRCKQEKSATTLRAIETFPKLISCEYNTAIATKILTIWSMFPIFFIGLTF